VEVTDETPTDPTPPGDPAPAPGDDSRPGEGHGDRNHDHTGPPGRDGRHHDERDRNDEAEHVDGHGHHGLGSF
jgi:hypothetical protein